MERYRDPSQASEMLIPGIDLRREHQLARWRAWQGFVAEWPFAEHLAPGFRYFFGNQQYEHADGLALYCMIRDLKPKRIIEVGSGYSSACILDTNELFSIEAACTFIDPNPQLVRALIKPSEQSKIIASKVQDVPLSLFTQLSVGDILLIDSTHIVKTCSDVVFELFEILPNLKPGVFVHFHDMFYPFEYPAEWVKNLNYSWNEIYAIRAFLMYNPEFQIEFWNDHLIKTAPSAGIPKGGGSLWISRV
jgi:hypothetical protein